jgi:hypothetical protein
MRFRGRFQWLQIATAILWIGLSCAWIHKATAPSALRAVFVMAGILQTCVLLFYLATYLTRWEITERALVQRRLWYARSIPWDQITRIGPWRLNEKPRYTWIEVNYARAAPMSDQGTLLLQPADRGSLVDELRSHAPRAEFEP